MMAIYTIIGRFFQWVTCTSCSVTCISTDTLKNVANHTVLPLKQLSRTSPTCGATLSPKDTSVCRKYSKICMWNLHLHHLHVKFEVHEDTLPAMRVNPEAPKCVHITANGDAACMVLEDHKTTKGYGCNLVSGAIWQNNTMASLCFVQYMWLQLSICGKYRWKDLFS